MDVITRENVGSRETAELIRHTLIIEAFLFNISEELIDKNTTTKKLSFSFLLLCKVSLLKREKYHSRKNLLLKLNLQILKCRKIENVHYRCETDIFLSSSFIFSFPFLSFFFRLYDKVVFGAWN